MVTSHRKPLEAYLATEYPLQVVASLDGGYVIRFPDLPGCVSQTDDLAEVGVIAEEIRTLWIETEYEAGAEIPSPSYSEEYSGKFNLRLPRSLHRVLAESAAQEGVSLNQYVTMLLGRRDAQAQIERRLETISAQVAAMDKQYDLKDRPEPVDITTARQGRSRYAMAN